MGHVLQTVQVRLKSSSSSFFTFIVKMISAFILGLTLALIGQETFGFELFSFVLIVVVVAGLFLRKARAWGMLAVLVFDLVCILFGLLLRVYILIAPGA